VKRSLLAVAVVLIAASAVTGAAASLGATGDRVDSFGRDQAAAAGDTTAPSLTSLEFFDASPVGAPNGKVDTVVATFNETLASYTAGAGPWTLTNAPGGAGNTVSSVNVSGAVATLTLNEGNVNTAPGSGATAFKLSLAANANGVRDASGNQSSFTDALVTDKAAPAASVLELLDAETPVGDGRVDRIDVTFIGEDLVPTASPNLAAWTKSGGPTGMSTSPTSGSISTTKATLNYGEGVVDTSTNGLQLALTASATGPRDAAGNQAAFFSRAVTDKAAPVVASMTMANGGATAGRPEQGDTITVVYSETLTTASLCPGQSGDLIYNTVNNDIKVLFTNGNNPTSDSFTVTVTTNQCTGGVLRFGQVTMGSSGYVTGSSEFWGNGNGKRTELTWTSATATLKITLGELRPGGASATAGASDATYDPDNGLSDPATNTVSGLYTFPTGSAVHF